MSLHTIQAFPFSRFDENGVIDWAHIEYGMSLADYFAGQALTSALKEGEK